MSTNEFTNPPISLNEYQQRYQASLREREEYWRGQALRLCWSRPFSTVCDEDLTAGRVAWFEDGELNGAACVFTAVEQAGRLDEPALLQAHGAVLRRVTYRELHQQVLGLAASLHGQGLQAGDRVALLLRPSPEAVALSLACALLGLTYLPLRLDLPVAVLGRIVRNCEASLLIAGPGAPLGESDQAAALVGLLGAARTRTVGEVSLPGVRPLQDPAHSAPPSAPPVPVAVAAEHPLFLLYSGIGTGIPRGAVFATGGYLVQARTSFRDLFLGGREPSRQGAALAVAWPLAAIAFQTYGLWGPLLLGQTVVLPAGDGEIGRVELERLQGVGGELMLLCPPRTLASLKTSVEPDPLGPAARLTLIACCGDVLTPRLVNFAATALTTGPERIMNLWIQNSGGVALLATLPVAELNRAGAVGLAVPAIEPRVLNDAGAACRVNESGQLLFASSWPAMVRTLWGQPERFQALYFSRFPGHFSTNDGARVDREGFFWLMGRLDDVIKVEGRSLATSEVEAVLTAHPAVSEAAVVGLAGEEGGRLVSFLVPRNLALATLEQQAAAQQLEGELATHVRTQLGEYAVPVRFHFVRELPRTRSGKVVRRVLRRIAVGDASTDEDWSHIANPGALEDLLHRVER